MESVKQFHECFEAKKYTSHTPELVNDKELIKLRISLIKEELNEFINANKSNDRVEMIDALGDMLYVIYGAGIAFAIDLDKVFNDHHNMNDVLDLLSESRINYDIKQSDIKHGCIQMRQLHIYIKNIMETDEFSVIKDNILDMIILVNYFAELNGTSASNLVNEVLDDETDNTPYYKIFTFMKHIKPDMNTHMNKFDNKNKLNVANKLMKIVNATEIKDIVFNSYLLACLYGINVDNELSKRLYNIKNIKFTTDHYSIINEYYNEIVDKNINYDKIIEDSNKQIGIMEQILLNETIYKPEYIFTQIGHVLYKLLLNTYLLSCILKFDINTAFKLIHESNMTKVCVSEEEAKKSVEFYKKSDRYDSPSYRLSKNNKDWIVFNESTNKVLKSINYIPVDLTTLA